MFVVANIDKSTYGQLAGGGVGCGGVHTRKQSQLLQVAIQGYNSQ